MADDQNRIEVDGQSGETQLHQEETGVGAQDEPSASEAEKTAPSAESKEEEQGIFSDLLRDAPISSLHIEEPEFDDFDMTSVLEEARTITQKPRRSRSKLGKRIRQSISGLSRGDRHNAEPAEKSSADLKIEKQAAEPVKPESTQEAEPAPLKIAPFKDDDDDTPTSLLSAPHAAEEDRRQSEGSLKSVSHTMEDLINSLPDQQEDLPEDDSDEITEKELSFEDLVNSEDLFEAEKKPRTFSELLRSGFGSTEEHDDDEPILEGESLMEDEDGDVEDSRIVITRTRAMPSLTEKMKAMEEKKKAEAERKAREKAEAAARKAREQEEEEDDAVYDPKASLVDDYRYDEYQDKKHFLLSDYKKTEDYLNSQSRQGYHYVHHEGKKFYFIKGKPHNFYYKILYFAKDPGDDYWDKLEDEGWRQINTSPSRNKRDAGWYVVRNEKKEGDLSKVIENEEEKYRYFSKFSASCRSTMFLLFIVMVCSALTMWLQYEFKGFLAVIIASGVLFFVALWVFLVYARLLNKSRKQASLLAARMRLADSDPKYQEMLHAKDSDQDLDDAWDAIDAREDDEDDD